MPVIRSSLSLQDSTFVSQKEAFLDSITQFRKLEEGVIAHSNRAQKKFENL